MQCGILKTLGELVCGAKAPHTEVPDILSMIIFSSALAKV